MGAAFLLAWRALWRGRLVALLLLATALIHALVPGLVRSDGTPDGWREMFVRAVPGSVYALVLLTLMVTACGAVARERERNRLALAAVRPVRAFAWLAGHWCAFATAAALVLAASAGLTAVRLADAPDCRRHIGPSLPDVVTCARAMMADYLADPATPEAVRKAPRGTVLALLAGKETDRYESIAPGQTFSWPLVVPPRMEGARIRVRFSTAYDLRASVNGLVAAEDWSGVVSNNTQAVLDVPLAPGARVGKPRSLSFRNTGKTAVMLRPRRDIELLLPADSFRANLVRAHLQMLALVALACAFALFLSASLSRPVSVFTATVTLLVVLLAPSVVTQFSDTLDAPFLDRLGLTVSRAVSAVTASATAAAPVADLATDAEIAWPALARTCAIDLLALPAAFLALAAFIVRRRAAD